MKANAELVDALNDLPIETLNGATVYIHDARRFVPGRLCKPTSSGPTERELQLLTVLKWYEAGVDTILFVIQYQADLSQVRSTEVVAKGDYFKAVAGLDRAAGVFSMSPPLRSMRPIRGI